MSSVAIKGTLICYRQCLYLYVYVADICVNIPQKVNQKNA